MKNPLAVGNARLRSAQTSNLKRGTPSSVRSSPKTRQGTERWNALIPSKATTATVRWDAVVRGERRIGPILMHGVPWANRGRLPAPGECRLMNKGYAFVATAAVLFASAGIAADLTAETSPAAISAARTILGGAALAGVAPKGVLQLVRRLPLGGLLSSGAAMALFQWSFFSAVQTLGVAAASLLSAGISPVAAGLLTLARQRSVPRWTFVAANCVAGLAVSCFVDSRAAGEGALLAVLSAFAYAIYADRTAHMDRDNRGGGIASTAVGLLCAGVVLLPAAWLGFAPLLSPKGLAVLVYLAVFATAFAYWLFVAGLRQVCPPKALAVLVVQAAAAVVGAAVLLGESIPSRVLAGSACLGIAVALQALPVQTNRQRSAS
jgi:DME family drug/metabolite transporter